MVLNCNGIQLYYERSGSGRPLLMVHGNGEDHTIFEEAAEILKTRFTCYLLDSRGHGQSTAVSELHYEDMAQDVLSFLEKLDLHDVIFYGFSDGGIIGLLAASRCDRIGTLIVSGANLSPKGVKRYLRILFRFLYLFHRDPKIRLMMTEPHIRDELLERISVPTLVTAGSNDLILEAETRHICALIPQASLHILPGERHGSYIVHSRKIAALIEEFCS